MTHRVEAEIGGKKLILETGRLAKQADGAVLATYGESVLLATAVSSKEGRKDADFVPLTVDYQERSYAAGKIPGGFFRREGRASETETLGCRLIDRPLRPLFPKNWYFETQMTATVLSSDRGAAIEILGICAASAALMVSDIVFAGPVGAVRVGRVAGNWIINPTWADLEKSDLNMVVAGTKNAVMMIENESKELSEETIAEGVCLAQKSLQVMITLQEQLHALAGKEKRTVSSDLSHPDIKAIRLQLSSEIAAIVRIGNKQAREETLIKLLRKTEEGLNSAPGGPGKREIAAMFEDVKRTEIRRMILDSGIRPDGRDPFTVRPISCETGLLPRAHGSALFTRGETQGLGIATLGTGESEQRIDTLEGEAKKRFMLHYNFPGFSVGEAKPMRGPGRREIGHGALAERALAAVIPSKEAFPYTIRVVSDILESNGSTSMASVCSGSLAMMDAGVPLLRPVSGIAMGLVKEGDKGQILTDILGIEDHLGDMDFKVAGTAQGITAMQLDTKINHITPDWIIKFLNQAKVGRLHILDKMLEVLPAAKTTLSPYAPQMVSIQVKPDKVRAVIGSGGKVVKGIIEQTGVKIDIEDNGVIKVASADGAAIQKAIAMIKAIVDDVEVGQIYVGKVVRIMDFGAFVELKKGVDGLVHISQLAHHRVTNVTDVVKEGDEVTVKVLEIDRQGKIRLSRKELLPKPENV